MDEGANRRWVGQFPEWARPIIAVAGSGRLAAASVPTGLRPDLHTLEQGGASRRIAGCRQLGLGRFGNSRIVRGHRDMPFRVGTVGMKTRRVLLLLGAGLLLPGQGRGQETASALTIQAAAQFSEFRYKRGSEAEWRASSTGSLRVLLRDRVYGELFYTAPLLSEEQLICPAQGSCGQRLTAWHFSILGGGAGVRFQLGEWMPFIGVAYGRFKTEDESHPTWMGSTGLERNLNSRTGLLVEYRMSRVNWPYEGGVSVNHEIGIGLTVSVLGF